MPNSKVGLQNPRYPREPSPNTICLTWLMKKPRPRSANNFSKVIQWWNLEFRLEPRRTTPWFFPLLLWKSLNVTQGHRRKTLRKTIEVLYQEMSPPQVCPCSISQVCTANGLFPTTSYAHPVSILPLPAANPSPCFRPLSGVPSTAPTAGLETLKTSKNCLPFVLNHLLDMPKPRGLGVGGA